jgi:4-aminobutyrate aminotransferase-like enzyme
VRGVGSYLYDAAGRGYLDCVNNVTHVGHANERVNRAMSEQQARVNTNTVSRAHGTHGWRTREDRDESTLIAACVCLSS